MFAPVHSSILILGINSHIASELGAEIVDSSKLALETIEQNKIKALAVGSEQFGSYELLKQFLQEVRAVNSHLQTAISYQNLSAENLQELFNLQLIDWIFESFEDHELPSILQRSIEAYNQTDQQAELLKLFDDQNERLTQLRRQLEDRVEKRQRYLISSQKRLASANEKIELLHASLIAIHQAQSLSEIESYLYAALKDNFQIGFIKMTFPHQTNFNEQYRQQQSMKVIEFPILSDQREIGTFHIARDVRQPFRPDEREFFSQISEAVSLAVNRLITLEQSEALKLQWEATFDAFSEPLCIVSSDRKVIRTNKAMATYSGKSYNELVGKNPFSILTPESNEDLTHLPVPFRVVRHAILNSSEFVFEVTCQSLTLDESSDVQIVIFRDLTEQARLEKHALESSKMAELGTIGSSIAHELNNPLGGVMNFLQLMKMDLRPKDENFVDIEEMEAAAHRCKEIIENLLGFARKTDDEEAGFFNLGDAVFHALKLVELQTKSKGIKVHYPTQKEPLRLAGQRNQIVQAIRNILQNAIEAIDKKQSESSFDGRIDLIVTADEKQIELEIRDNGVGISKEILPKIFNPLFSTKNTGLAVGLGLTVAFKIISDHNGTLEVSSQSGQGTSAKITMKSPELMG